MVNKAVVNTVPQDWSEVARVVEVKILLDEMEERILKKILKELQIGKKSSL